MVEDSECRTHVYERGEEVVGAVQARVDGEQKDLYDVVGKHQRRLRHVEAVPRKRRRHRRPAGAG